MLLWASVNQTLSSGGSDYTERGRHSVLFGVGVGVGKGVQCACRGWGTKLCTSRKFHYTATDHLTTNPCHMIHPILSNRYEVTYFWISAPCDSLVATGRELRPYFNFPTFRCSLVPIAVWPEDSEAQSKCLLCHQRSW